MIYPVFEVDTFKSKMGEDKDVCVVSFLAKDRSPARDLMDFVEKGYNFVLDADVSAGENNNGDYSIFIELSRSPELAENIKDLTYGIKKLTGIDNFKFKYHKQDQLYDLSEEALKKIIPQTPSLYEQKLEQAKTESIKNFFNKTLMDDIRLENSVITIYKPFDKQIKLRLIDDAQAIVEGAPSLDGQSTAEVFWLTKVLGDYDITKFGDTFLFTNGDQTMFLQRIEQ